MVLDGTKGRGIWFGNATDYNILLQHLYINLDLVVGSRKRYFHLTVWGWMQIHFPLHLLWQIHFPGLHFTGERNRVMEWREDREREQWKKREREREMRRNVMCQCICKW